MAHRKGAPAEQVVALLDEAAQMYVARVFSVVLPTLLLIFLTLGHNNLCI